MRKAKAPETITIVSKEPPLPQLIKRPMTMRQRADAYRTAQAKKMLDLFELAKGHPARSFDEMERWCASKRGQAILKLHHNEDGKIDPYKTVAMPGLVRKRRNLKPRAAKRG